MQTEHMVKDLRFGLRSSILDPIRETKKEEVLRVSHIHIVNARMENRFARAVYCTLIAT